MLKKLFDRFLFLIKRIKVFLFRKNSLNNYRETKKLILFLFPNDDIVNGGILSINTIYNEFEKFKHLHKCDLMAVTYSYLYPSYFFNFKNFKNDLEVFDLKDAIKLFNNLEELHIHIPELFLKQFVNEFDSEWQPRDKESLLSIEYVSINILNQNDMLMPNKTIIKKIAKSITQHITMTVAHKRYATYKKFLEYGVSLHYLSAWLNMDKYVPINLELKDNIILFSPDELSRMGLSEAVSKKVIIDRIKQAFPLFEVVVINNLTYESYKKLVQKSKYMITFGEGLDAYFIDTVKFGGLSFAIYNEVFFTEDYKNLKTVYNSMDKFLDKIISDIKYFETEPSEYIKYQKRMLKVVDIEYSYNKYQNRVEQFLLGNYDFK